jgi:hypothetical protein
MPKKIILNFSALEEEVLHIFPFQDGKDAYSITNRDHLSPTAYKVTNLVFAHIMLGLNYSLHLKDHDVLKHLGLLLL